ncbi:MAG TPA: amino acid ABC transporter permease [Candidatus Thalassarchaeaceae archaeon]|jgi:His/Glu/Gln/Arg/opine family amino acid ABC transporter permease subunit|nr:amino acid ABC transporter permease [Candidatus Thalassarchaeaceae archaeon]HJL55551.1 amino acid ABC transporter permease [Candidatus Thalassarchaeaceae archaeon]HJM77774.1 amino acid ABC transporter permease [Candidatus Thalassarchaeaceae archaeon]|tara:strand:+ start:384 stop:2015 length:1632 start_codon:yes stop_codon:yes gene_type:complete
MDSLIELEESIAGKPGGPWVTPSNNTQLSLLAISLALACGLLGGMWEGYLPNGFFELVAKAESEGASSQYALVFSAISALVIVFAWWVTFTALIKWTPGKTRATAMLGIATAWIIVVAVRGFSHFVLVEADWDVVWANRVLLVIGQQMTEQMTQAPGSESCISTCYGINQNWRLWWVLYPTFAVVASAYGTAAEKPARFLVPFSLVVFGLMAVAWTPSEINYHREVPMTNLAKALVIGWLAYGASFYYCSISEEYKANRLRSYIAMGAVATFFFAIMIMNPPGIVKDLAAALGGTPAQGMREAIIAGEVIPSTLDKLAGDGIEASQWGGLFVNLIVATAGCVLGFGIGVVLAFGRQSKQPFFSMPSIAVIELVRSGPLICWLWFAVFLMPDMMDPFYDAEDIIRMLLMFGIFGGCYIAEVLRGGLQAVDSGQKEAAVALGLSPFQTKMQVELPNAVRTTLPSIVSVFIGLWKDTTLLFIINILDFFKLAKDLPATDLRFLGNFLEPLYVTAFVFWVFAFYLSRISMKIEKGLGLGIEGGGEAA